MSVKQDRSYARTAQDLERKYQFGKTFADMLGLINDNRDKVDSVESKVRSVENATKLLRDDTQVVVQATEQVKTDLEELSKEVEMKIDANGVSIIVEQELANGVDRVETAAGYTFDNKGLTISKSGEEMTNVIDNTGMYVKRDGNAILSANNNGVDAVNLHAKTYLIVGSGEGRSRFEDYGNSETGCFWIGG